MQYALDFAEREAERALESGLRRTGLRRAADAVHRGQRWVQQQERRVGVAGRRAERDWRRGLSEVGRRLRDEPSWTGSVSTPQIRSEWSSSSSKPTFSSQTTRMARRARGSSSSSSRPAKRPRITPGYGLRGALSRPTSIQMPKRARYNSTRFHAMNCVEFKSHNFSEGAAGPSTSAYIVSLLEGISLGSGEHQRVGNRIFLKSLDLALKIQIAAGTEEANYVRAVVVMDKQSNGTTPSWTDVFDDSTPLSFRNLHNTNRFVILKDWRFPLQHTGGAYTGTTDKLTGGMRIMGCHKELKGTKVQYTDLASGGENTSVADNNIWLMVLTDNTTADSLAVTSRIRYTD